MARNNEGGYRMQGSARAMHHLQLPEACMQRGAARP